jgi:hypothetical protein
MKEMVERILIVCKQKFNTENIHSLTFSQRKSLKIELSNMITRQDIIMLKKENLKNLVVEDYSSVCLKKNFKSLSQFLSPSAEVELVKKKFSIKNRELILKKYEHPQLETIFEDNIGNTYKFDMSLTHSHTIPEIKLSEQNFRIIEEKTQLISNKDIVGNLAEQRLGRSITWVDGTVDLKKLINNDFQKNYDDRIEYYLEKNKDRLEELVIDKMIDFAECITNKIQFINYDICAYYIQQAVELILASI